MELMTKELESQFNEIGSQENEENPVVVAKFFNPTGIGTWYATEYNQKDKVFFGYVSLFGDHCDEWGSFSLEELESIKGQFGLGIERDLHTSQKPISEFNIPSLATV